MALFTITTFSTFAGLLLAAQKLAADPNLLNRVKALADLATGGKALAAALNDAGLTPLAQQMAACAEDADRAYAHDGPDRENARAIFWQVAPAALADPAAMVAGGLDADAVTDRLVAAIRTSPHGLDFATTTMAEAYFRAVARPTLAVMLAKADFIATITPGLWRSVLAKHGVEIALLERLDGKIDAQSAQLDRMEALLLARFGQPPPGLAATVVELARRVAPRTEDIEAALNELRRAVGIAAEMQARGEAGSDVDGFVDVVLRRLAALTREGRLDEAAMAADEAADRAEAGLSELLDAAVNQHLLAFDAEGASRQIVRRLILDVPDPAGLFDALRREEQAWYERGRDKGLRLDLEVAIALARTSRTWALDADQRGAALSYLGVALATLGERERGAERLEEAVAVFRVVLGEWARERAPLIWARTQMYLGNVLMRLGEREHATVRLEEAVAAFRAALEERTRERVPLGWAATQTNLGNALAALGEREIGTARLEEAVVAYRAALIEQTRERVPLEWARTQSNLGTALQTIGLRESGTARLEEAVAAYREAMKERTRERVPLDWAETQNNLGNALERLGAREMGTARLEEAVVAYRAALEEWTRERMPLQWALATGNEGLALLVLATRTSKHSVAREARDRIATAEVVLREGGNDRFADHYAGRLPYADALIRRLAGG